MDTDERNEMTKQECIEAIYADLKLSDRLTPGRTPWQTLRKRAEDIATYEHCQEASISVENRNLSQAW
jgi:hypothetical protein